MAGHYERKAFRIMVVFACVTSVLMGGIIYLVDTFMF